MAIPPRWAGRAPLLFPIVGALAGGTYRWDFKTYPLARHGFARGKMFSIESTAASSAVFRLNADEDTLQVYPFDFELQVHFKLIGATLSLATQIRNKGPGEMPASFEATIPRFCWPLPSRAAAAAILNFVDFETDEPALQAHRPGRLADPGSAGRRRSLIGAWR